MCFLKTGNIAENFGTKFGLDIEGEKLEAMGNFEIKFDFPVASTNLKISLNATVEIHHSEPYYVVHDFYFTDSRSTSHSVLPEQEVKRVKCGDKFIWVHKDSEQTSELSIAIGKGIENVLTKEELDNPE